MLIDFSKKKKLVTYREKPKKTPEILKEKKLLHKPSAISEVDALLIKSAELLDESTSLFQDIPLKNAEIAVMVDPCKKFYKSAVLLYDQYII